MAESKDFAAEAGTAKVVGTVSSTGVAEPVAPPTGLRAVGPRITFHFAGEWNAETSYVLYDVVRVNGTSYIANKVSIAKGVNPEADNNVHWVKWNDPNAQVELLQQTANSFDARITEAKTEAMNAAGDAAEAKKASADNANAISAEATRAKVAEAANKTAIEAETARAKEAEAANATAIANINVDKTELVIIGDSWSDERVTGVTWPRIVSESTGWTRHNYAISGIGDDLDGQITQFANDASFDKNKIAAVVIMDGVNVDISDPQATWKKWKGFINRIDEIVPKSCKIYWFFNFFAMYKGEESSGYNTTIVDYVGNQRELIREMTSLPRVTPVTMYDMVPASVFNETGYHLTESGQTNYLAPKMVQILQGSPMLKDDLYKYDLQMGEYAVLNVSANIVNGGYEINVVMRTVPNKTIPVGYSASLPINGFWGFSTNGILIDIEGKALQLSFEITSDGKGKCNVYSTNEIQLFATQKWIGAQIKRAASTPY